MRTTQKGLALGASLAATVTGLSTMPGAAAAAPAPTVQRAAPAALACNPEADMVKIDHETLTVGSSYFGPTTLGFVELWYSANCRQIRSVVVMDGKCGQPGDLGDAYCGTVELWKQNPGGGQRFAHQFTTGESKYWTPWFDDANIKSYGKATAPATAVTNYGNAVTVAY